MKCRYTNCKYLHDTNDISIGEEVKFGKQYYHHDCLLNKDNIKEINSLFRQYIDRNVVASQLNAVIKTIVFEKKQATSDYLLFGLKYYIDNNISLKHPQGLYYVIKNDEVKNKYDTLISKNTKEEFKRIDYSTQNETVFTYRPKKSLGFGDIFRKE